MQNTTTMNHRRSVANFTRAALFTAVGTPYEALAYAIEDAVAPVLMPLAYGPNWANEPGAF